MMGVGQVTSNPQFGMQQAASLLSLEGLAIIGRDGKSRPLLAAEWTSSSDGRILRLHLRPSVKFHDGTPVNAATIKMLLERELRKALGPAGKEVSEIKPVSDLEVEIHLEQRSNFVTDALDFPITAPGKPTIGTGPFYTAAASATGIEMPANHTYYLGSPSVDRVVLKPYGSFRSAWADMLRGHLDMLYEVGLEGLDSLQPASNVRVFVHTRNYAYLIVLNTRQSRFEPAKIRRALNEAIDRDRLIAEGVQRHGEPANGPVWPHHWAYNSSFAQLNYKPAEAEAVIRNALRGEILRFSCLIPAGQAYEQLAIAVQRQLKAVGVEMGLEGLSNDEIISRVTSGNFEAALVDARIGPTPFQGYQWWYSDGPRNYVRFKSTAVDDALDRVRRAPDEMVYRKGMAAFQQAVIEDPPAIFLIWSQRARAVSSRFRVPADVGRDVFGAIRLFTPVTAAEPISRK